MRRVIGDRCKSHNDCIDNVKYSYCANDRICRCRTGHIYHHETDTCNRPKMYGQRCSDDDGCYQHYLTCSKIGYCTCSYGFHFDADKNPFCQPNNSSSCDRGYYWSESRNRCVKTVEFWIHGSTYEKPRYSLLTVVILVLCLVIIFKKNSRKHLASGQLPLFFTQRPSFNDANVYDVQTQTNRPIPPLPPPPYMDTNPVQSAHGEYLSDGGRSDRRVSYEEPPPPYEQAIKMQPLG